MTTPDDPRPDPPLPVEAHRRNGASGHLRPVGLDEGRPIIEITTEQHLVNDAAVRSLATDPLTFQRAGQLVRLVRAPTNKRVLREADAPRISPMPPAQLRERLTFVAQWRKRSRDGNERSAHPPEWTVGAVHARGEWPGVRPLAGVIEAPALRPDGSIIEVPGYDPTTELLYWPNADFWPVMPKPTHEDAVRALTTLNEPFVDFPFEKPEHRSAMIATVLTTFARHAFAGSVPMTVVDANAPGAGKSLSSDLVGTISTGRPMARMANTRDDDEMRKRLMSLALSADPLLLIDNVEGVLGSASLNLAITGEALKDRILGTNDAPSVRLVTQFLATGNNIVLDGDTTRRALHVRLQTDYERPEERAGFRHPDIRAWTRANRPALVCAALTVLRGYFVAGRPDQGLKPWGSFEGWSSLIRNTLAWAGWPDPGLTREELKGASDGDAEILDLLITGWDQVDVTGQGLTVREAIDRVKAKPGDYSNLNDAFDHLCNGKPPTPRTVGNRMKHFRGRILNGKQILVEKNRDGFSVWRATKVRSL